MRCRDPCGHQFCWLCLGNWDTHDAANGGFYNCNKYQAAKLEGKFTDEELRRRQAKESSDRYLHYYERWGAHELSRHKALKDLAALSSSSDSGGQLEAAAAAFGVQVTQLDFIKHAYRQVAECRRMLRWTYAFGFFVQEPAKRDLFEMLQSDAEKSLERLHGCAEKDRTDMLAPPFPVCDDDGKLVPHVADFAADKYAQYRHKLLSLTMVTRDHFENLARAFRDGLAEVDTTAAAANAVVNAAKAAKRKDPRTSVHRYLFTEE